LTGRELAHSARAALAGFRKFSKKKSCITRTRRAQAGLTVYPPWIQIADVATAALVLSHAIENQNSDFVMQ
jgi:hypothetical protein